MKTIRLKIEIAGMDTILSKVSEPLTTEQYTQLLAETKEVIKSAAKGDLSFLDIILHDNMQIYIGKDLLPKSVISIIVEDTSKLTTPDGPY